MRVLVSSTGTVRHAAARTDGTLCNTTGSSRGYVRWYWRNGDVTCKNCLRKLANEIAAAWDEAHTENGLRAGVRYAAVQHWQHGDWAIYDRQEGVYRLRGLNKTEAVEQERLLNAPSVTDPDAKAREIATRLVESDRSRQRNALLALSDETARGWPGDVVQVGMFAPRSGGVHVARALARQGAAEERTDPRNGFTLTDLGRRVVALLRSAEVTPASARTVAGACAVRTRVAIGTQIAEACAALGIELGHGTAKGLPCYVVNGAEYTAGELADLVLEGGFDGAYGRAETIVRQDSPLKPAPVDPQHARAADDAAQLELPCFTAHRATLLDLSERTVTAPDHVVDVETVPTDTGTWLVRRDLAVRRGRFGAITPPLGYALTMHGLRVAALLKEFPTEVGPYRATLGELVTRNSIATLVESEIIEMAESRSRMVQSFLVPREPLTVDQAGEKIATEYGDALVALGQEETGEDARAKAHPYRPAVGELVVGTLKSNSTGRLIGGLQIGEFEGVDTRYGIAHLRDGHMVVAVDVDSMRPAPQVPDASHLIGRKITADLAVGLDGDTRTGIVREVLRPSADGLYVVMQLESGWIVRVPVALVEQTAPKAGALPVREMAVGKSTDADGVERWKVGVRLQPEPVMVNLTVTRPEMPRAEAEPSPYVPSEVSGGGWYVVDSRYGPSAFDRVVRRDSGAPATWFTFEDASEAADALWAQEATGERSSGDRV